MRILMLLFGLTATHFVSWGQNQNVELMDDSTFIETDEEVQVFTEVSTLDPQRSALLSAIFPGLGQIYNKQYWKLPIVYGGLFILGHLINYNNRLYHAFRNAAITQSYRLENPFNEVIRSREFLIRNRDNFRRDRDYFTILGVVFYVLNIVDAHVSSHLDEFNVNEDLTLSLKPTVETISFASTLVGGSFIIKF